MKKRSGFTLIEVIIAMAIFAIATASISFTINTSSQMYKEENIKFQTISAANSILQQLKSRGTAESAVAGTKITSLQSFFSYTGVDDYSTTEIHRFMYFNYDDLSTLPLNISSYISYTGTGDFSLCKSTRTDSSKHFGAVVSISRTHAAKTDSTGTNLNIDWYYNIYNINVKVWNLDQGESTLAEISASVSR